MPRIEFLRKRPVFVRGQNSVALCPAVGIVHHAPRNVDIVTRGGNAEMDEKSEICFLKKPAGAGIFRSFKRPVRRRIADYVMLLGCGLCVIRHDFSSVSPRHLLCDLFPFFRECPLWRPLRLLPLPSDCSCNTGQSSAFQPSDIPHKRRYTSLLRRE